MNGTLIERLKRWWCRKFGHRPQMLAGGVEVCRRCQALLSTPYSRARDAAHRPPQHFNCRSVARKVVADEQ